MPIHISADLVDRARTSDPAELEALLEAVWPQAYRLARAIVVDASAAEDIAQESCVAAFRTIGSLRTTEAFGTWFYRIVVHESLKWKKAAKRALPTDLEPPYDADLIAYLDLWHGLATLSRDKRITIVLYYFEGLRTREIADVLRVPAATVRFRLMSARRQLRHLLTNDEASTHRKSEESHAV